MQEPKNLTQYKLSDKGKALLPTASNPHGRKIILSKSETDPYFECQAIRITDYMAKEILARKDGKGKDLFDLEPVKKESAKKKDGLPNKS